MSCLLTGRTTVSRLLTFRRNKIPPNAHLHSDSEKAVKILTTPAGMLTHQSIAEEK